MRRQERTGAFPLSLGTLRNVRHGHRARLAAILWRFCLACVVMITIALPGTARADLDPAVREAVAAAAVKLAALVTVREGRTTTEEIWPLGSATIVSPDGVLLTNTHVVELSGLKARLAQEEDAAKRQGRDRQLQLLEGRAVVLVTEGAELRRAYIADVLVTEPAIDLAVLRITAGAHGEPLSRMLQLPYVPLGDSDTLRIGDLIHVFGYPATAGGTLKYTQGRVSGFDIQPGVLGWAWIDSDATVSGGSSGGTAVNDAGQLIGIPTLATELDCRPGDTNGDGVIDEADAGCIPIGDSFLRMRPVNLAKPLLLQVSSFFAATPEPTISPTAPPVSATATPVTATTEATPAGRGAVLLQDTFDDPSRGVISTASRDPSRVRFAYEGGEFVISLLDEATPNRAQAGVPGWFTDTITTIDARLTGETARRFLAISCRGNEFGVGGYELIVQPDSRAFGLWRWDSSGNGIPLESGMGVAAVNPGAETNRLELRCIGDVISASVNGTEVTRKTDATIPAGTVTLSVGVLSGVPSGASEARFDNLVITKPAQGTPIESTPSPTPTRTPTTVPTDTPTTVPTATPAPDDAAILDALKQKARESSSIAGPLKGKLEQQDGTIVFASADVWVRDFYVRARFTNPRDSAEMPWDYGLGFRDNGQGAFYMLVVTSEGTYHLYLRRDAYETIAEGVVPSMLLAASERNELGLVVVGPAAYFEVNGEYVATLDLSASLEPGQIWVGTGFFADHTLPGDRVAYDRFEVWSLDAGVNGDAQQFTRLRDGALATASLAGPFAGVIEQRVGELDGFFAGVTAQDFYLRTEFVNPFPASEHIWDIGIAFRHTGSNQQLRLIIRSDGMWFATDGADAPFASGLAMGLRTGANESNVIELIAAGDEGYLAINGQFVARLDLSARVNPGDIWLGSGFFTDDVVTGALTSFTGFQVWPLGNIS
ncbi:MAG: hypothetical protein KatS3mg059_1015 [Thermomicrobiales bacterium]|nr:MAG: hypothetical protein KatS3mg059_1015 [Thermomicrobiales bacterium]